MRQVSSPGGPALTVHELGGTGRPTLLCHATGFHGLVWEPLAAALPSGLERWAMDFRAHGASVVPPDQPLEWAGFAADVLAVVDGLGLAPGEVLGIGHSMGGGALLMAEQSRPGTFAGLWVFEPIVPPPGALPIGPDGDNPLATGVARRRSSFPSAAEALANFAAKPPLSRLRADVLHAYVRHGFVADPSGDGTVHLACRPADEAQTYRAAGVHDGFARLGEVACPVVVACGDDAYGPGSFAPAVVDALPDGHLERFAQLSHFGPLESPDRVAAAIAEFVATL